jgi:uncharacterized DUF497 family protein
VIFEWNAAKSLANVRKHGVSFEEAATVFLDPQHGLFPILIIQKISTGRSQSVIL